MNQLAKRAVQCLITLAAIAWVVTGNHGQMGQIAVARGWSLLSGDLGPLQGFPLSDLLWAVVFLVGGWQGVLGFLGLLVMAFFIWVFALEEKRRLPLGTLALGFFVMIGFVVPGPFPLLLALLMLLPSVVQSGRLRLLLIAQAVWILSSPLSWALGWLWWRQRKINPKEGLAGIGLCLMGMGWDFWRLSQQRLDYVSSLGSYYWMLGLVLILMIRCFLVTKAFQSQTEGQGQGQGKFLPFGAGVVAFLMWGGLVGEKILAVQNSGFVPQFAEIQAFSELFKARPDLAFSPITTRSVWVWDYCRITAGLRHCALATGNPSEEGGQQFVLVGEANPRKAASAYLEEKKYWPTHKPLVFSGTVCLLGPAKNLGPNRGVQGLGVHRSAESVMAFAWFEGDQNGPPASKEEGNQSLQWAWKWAEMAVRENPKDGLAWGITGELILARSFLGTSMAPPTPMEIEAWLAQAAFCFRQSLDLNPLDGKIARVYGEVLKRVGALDLAQTLPQFSKNEGKSPRMKEETFLDSGPTHVMDLKYLLEFRYPGDSDRSLARVKEAMSLGLKGQALGELNRGAPERFGREGAKLRMQLLLQCGFADVARELAATHEAKNLNLGLLEWPRTQGIGFGANWKMPVLGWIQGVANLALFPHGGAGPRFESLIGILSKDLSQIQIQMVQGIPFAVAKMAMPIPQTPWAGRIESLKEWATLEDYASLGAVLREEIAVMKRLESGHTQP